MDPNPATESFLWIRFWNSPGMSDPPACAERTEAVLTPAAAYLEGASDPHAEGEVRHRSG
jgi:hypothetical protein